MKKGGHQSEIPVEKKNIVVGRGSEVGGQMERREVERGDESVGKDQKEEHDVKHWGEESKGWGI